MKRNPMPLLLFVIAVVVGFGLLLAGCGPNQAQNEAADLEIDLGESADLAALESPSGDTPEGVNGTADAMAANDSDDTLDERLEEVQARLARIEALEAAIATREEALLERQLELEAATPEPATVPALPDSGNEIQAVEPAPEPRTLMVRLSAGSELSLELREPLSSEVNIAGDNVRAVVAEDVVRRGLVIVPAGSDVLGTVVEVQSAKRIGGQASLSVRFDELVTPAGYQVAIQAFMDATGESQKKKDAAIVGGATAGGAILGRILNDGDRTRGTVIGGILGAAIGTAVAGKNKNDPIVLESGSRALISLDLPVHVAVVDTMEKKLVAGN